MERIGPKIKEFFFFFWSAKKKEKRGKKEKKIKNTGGGHKTVKEGMRPSREQSRKDIKNRGIPREI